MTITANISGINELDFPSGVSSVTVANGVATINLTGGGGGVSSVGMTGDNVIFNTTVGGSPVTTSGTLVPALLTQTANGVLAGPTSGVPATPTFRTLVTADVPNLDASKITTGSLALARGGTAVDLSASGSTTAVLAQDASHVVSARSLVAADIPSLNASKITTGQLTLAQGGTQSDLSATGGTSFVLRQSGIGAPITVSQLSASNLTDGTIGSGNVVLATAPTITSLSMTGLLTQYNNISTVANGVPAELAQVDLTTQSAAVATTTLYAVPASGAGQYRVSWDAKVTRGATTSSTLGPLTIAYTDPDGVTITTTMPACGMNPGSGIGESIGTNTTSGVLFGFPLLLNCKASTNITYAFAYVSSGATTMQYNLHIRLENLG